MKVYVVKENGNDVFVTKDLNMGMHEMISIIYSRLKVIYQSGYPISNINLSDIYIEEFTPHHGKRFRFITDKFFFDNNCLFVKSINSKQRKITNALNYCDEMLNQIKGMYNQQLNANQAHQNFRQNTNLYNNKLINSSVVNPVTNTNQCSVNDTKHKSKLGDILLSSANIINKTMATLNNNINTKPLIEITNETSKINDNIKIKDEDDIKSNISNISELISESDEFSSDNDDNVNDGKELDSKLKEIGNQIADLQKIKAHGEDQLNNLRKVQDEQVNDLIDYSADVNYLKKKLFIGREQEEERRRKFNADKKAYFLIKEDINKGKLKVEKILENPIFKNKYPVFEYMESKNILTQKEGDDDDLNNSCSVGEDYFIYSQLTKKNIEPKSKGYVPHNYNYLSEGEQKEYSAYLESKKDIIDEFLNIKNKIKSLDEILKELDGGPDSEYSDSDEIPDISIPTKTLNSSPINSIKENVNLLNDNPLGCSPLVEKKLDDDSFNEKSKIVNYDYDKLQETVNKVRDILN